MNDLEKLTSTYQPLTSLEEPPSNYRSTIDYLVEKDSSESKKPITLRDRASNFVVDVSAGYLFYTLPFAVMEYTIFGDIWAVVKSRALGLAVQALIMRPTGKLRNTVAKSLNVTKKSSWGKKYLANAYAAAPLQALGYGAILSQTGMPQGKQGLALICGIALATLSYKWFGDFQDWWREYWGKERAIGYPEELEEKGR